MKRFVWFLNTLLIILLVISCAKDQELIPLSKNQAVELITSTSQFSELTFQEIQHTDGFTTITYFHSLLDETGVITRKSRNLKHGNLHLSIYRYLSFALNFTNDLDTPYGNYGTYTWNAELRNWDFSDDLSNRAVYSFPSNENSEENDANFTILNYETNVTDGDTILKRFSITLSVNETLVYSANYNATIENERIEKFSISLNFTPFTSQIDFQSISLSNDETVNVLFSLKKEGVTLMTSKLGYLFEELNYSYFSFITGNSDIDKSKTIQGYFQVGSMKFTIDFETKEFLNAQSPIHFQESANSHLRVNLFAYPTGEYAAKIVWVYNSENDEIKPSFKYSDGSQEPAYDNLPYLVRDFFDDLFNN